MKKLTTLFILGLLAISCTKKVYPVNIKKAEEVCKSKGGIFYIHADPYLTVVCKKRDGDKHKRI